MVRQGGGRIVNFSGGGAASPLPRFSAYGVSKAAVVRLTETLAEEVKASGITVNAISPGFIDTQLQDDVLKAGGAAGDLFERVTALRESGAGKTPIDVPARLALFLACEDSRGLTGRVLAAPHDGWENWDAEHIDALEGTPWFTLRRIDPFTVRGLGAEPGQRRP
jgi:3-oxoacyl-[acyl-carrier protein] reductase